MDRLKMQDFRTKTSARSHQIKKLVKKPLASSHQMKKLSIMVNVDKVNRLKVEEAGKKFDTLGEAMTKLDQSMCHQLNHH
jgi:hypothetical protein